MLKDFAKAVKFVKKTIHKGKLPPAPMRKMPLIDVPFQRVAIYIIGPISPQTNEGHRYILTLIDYATRYPEAKALKGISSEEVAGALLSIFCRGGGTKRDFD